LNASAGPVAHCLAFAWASRRFGWVGSLLCSIAAFLVVAFTTSAFAMPAWAAFALVIAAIFASLRWMPRVATLAGPAAIPRIEIIVRVAAAGLIAAVVTFGATELGPRLSGVLLTFPISGTVMPAFTRALYGSDAAIRLLAGFIKGLTAFGVFFVVLAYCLVPCGPLVAFLLAIAIGLAASELVRRATPS
jgi:hypothetical protein